MLGHDTDSLISCEDNKQFQRFPPAASKWAISNCTMSYTLCEIMILAGSVYNLNVTKEALYFITPETNKLQSGQPRMENILK